MTIEQIIKSLNHRMGFWDCACTDDRPNELCLRCQVRELLDHVTLKQQGWSCGCGHINGINLARCAQCGRGPNESRE